MEISFLTPLGGLFALAALVPLAVFVARERRVSRIRASLGLRPVATSSRLAVGGALAASCGLLALAAAQPVMATKRVLQERTDAQIFAVIDTSRSMLASPEPRDPTRFDRARDLTLELAERFPEVPVGVASLTDRLLPHLFPTTDARVLRDTLLKTLGVENPGPTNFYATRATTFDALASAPNLNYFPPGAERRVLVVLTDGETRPLVENLAEAFERTPKVETVFVRLWGASERIYLTGAAEIGYEPDPESEELLFEIASTIGGRIVEEDLGALERAVAELVGTGPTTGREHEGKRRALMPYITLAAFLPLGLVLLRRNL